MTVKKILFIVTSHADLGATGHKTGYWLSELAHPYVELKNKGYDITLATPKGGEAPMDPGSKEQSKDDISLAFLADKDAQHKITNTVKLTEVNPNEYDAVVFPGGHGPMFDLATDQTSQDIVRTIWEQGKVVAGVCHGPAGIVNVKLSDGSYLIKGKHFTGFANTEEEQVKLTKVVPFLLEDQVKQNGGIYEKTADWGVKVVVDGKLVTGQNPASASAMAEQVHLLLQ
ncbi:DJ-1/PfpI family protein [Gorgonomyces haynaldii]|nr:DJ-1/PfpI family protein [Gorgonomyces haynaldii]